MRGGHKKRRNEKREAEGEGEEYLPKVTEMILGFFPSSASSSA